MEALLAEGQSALHTLAANLQEDLVVPRIRLALARQRVERTAKRFDEAGSNDAASDVDDNRAREMATADAAMAAAEVRQAKVQDVYWQRVGEVRAATKARLHAYWAWNLAARSEASRLLVAGLDLPELKDETAIEWER
jgi:hypothetical protein